MRTWVLFVCLLVASLLLQGAGSRVLAQHQVDPAERERLKQEAIRKARQRAMSGRNEPRASSNETPAAAVFASEDQLSEKEKRLLQPAAADQQLYAEFLRQPNTGLFKLLSAEQSRTLNASASDQPPLPLLGGGTYYSFTKRRHDVNEWAEIRLRDGLIQVGFAGRSNGAMTLLGDVPLEVVRTDSPGVAGLESLSPADSYAEAEAHHRRNEAGFVIEGFIYKSALPAAANTVYVLRSTSYRRADQLVIFRVVRQDPDGSLTILWKRLKSYPSPPSLKDAPKRQFIAEKE